MRATSRLLLFILCLLAGPSLAQPSSAKPSAAWRPAPTLRGLVQRLYRGDLGVRESGASNHGPRVKEYLHAIGLPEGYAWCSAFVVYQLRKAGVPVPRFGRARSWFDKRHTIWNGAQVAGRPAPQTGDLVGFRWGAAAISHVEFLDIWGETPACQTVGGNTRGKGKSRDGDGVYTNWRLKSQVTAVANVIDDPTYAPRIEPGK